MRGRIAGVEITLERAHPHRRRARRTSVPKIWAGGDCIAGGEDLTVVSVEDGKIAAESIHQALMG
jgi:dihydropyrimidine dehydrogenase (NAD+) subunit PreT